MVSPLADPGSGPARAFLVERYVAPSAADSLPASTGRAAELCNTSHLGVQYLYSSYLPSEDTCFCLFQAASADEVRALNRQADFAFDRITEADLFICNTTARESLRRPS